MLYAYTRICSIGRNAGLSREEILAFAKTEPVSLEHEKVNPRKTFSKYERVNPRNSLGKTFSRHEKANPRKCQKTIFSLGFDFLFFSPLELKLGKLLARFPEIILKMCDDLFLHTLCEFMYQGRVVTRFSDFVTRFLTNSTRSGEKLTKFSDFVTRFFTNSTRSGNENP